MNALPFHFPTRQSRRLIPGPASRGSAVITVLVLAAVTALIASSFLSRAAQEARLASRSYYQAAALNLAEAGIEEALYAINTSTVNSGAGWELVSGTSDDFSRSITSGLSFPQATGSVHARIDGANGSAPTITALGVIQLPNQPQILKQLRVGGSGPTRLFGNGIVAKGTVTFSGSANIDSYDSSLGDWNASTNRSDQATVASNTVVQVLNSADIYGYVATGGTQPNVGGSGRIYGATSTSTPKVDPSRVRLDFNANLVDATAPTTSAYSLGAYAPGAGTNLPRVGDVPGANGRYLYTCTSLSLGGSANLNIKGPVDIIVTGNISVGGSSYLSVGGSGSTDPSLNIYCPGTISLGGSGMINSTADCGKVTIWGTAPTGSTQTLDIGGSGSFKGTIYAPNGNINLNGSGDMYGAVIGNTVTVGGSGVMHYDVQLASLITTGGPTPGPRYMRVGLWSELTASPSSGAAFARDDREPFATFF